MKTTSEPVDYDPFAGADAPERVVPTTDVQREIWLAAQLGAEASLAYNESVCLRLKGELDSARFQKALQSLMDRHEALRSRVSQDGQNLWIAQQLALSAKTIDISTEKPEKREKTLQIERENAVKTPFDLAQGPLVRAVLLRTGPQEHELILTAHHIVCDGWSFGVLMPELMALYSGQTLKPAESFGAYALSQLEAEHQQTAQADARYWISIFERSAPVLDLPTDRPRQAHRSFASKREDAVLSAAQVKSLKDLGAAQGCSFFVVLFAAFYGLLARICGSEDVVVGVSAAGQAAVGQSALVGHCVHLLPIRITADLSQDVNQLLASTRTQVLDGYEHQHCTFGNVLKGLTLQRDASRLPLVSVLFNLDSAIAAESLSLGGLQADLQSNPRCFENFELFLNAVPTDDGGLRLECQYNTDLFTTATIQRWLGVYQTLLTSMVSEPTRAVSSLPLLSDDESAALAAFQPLPQPPGASFMHERFVQLAAREPKRVAVKFENQSLTYAQLDERSNRLAQALRARGIKRGDHIGLCLPRGLDMLMALIAVLKAGATYVPLDPSFPAARLAFYAEDAPLALLLTHADVENAPRAWAADAANRILELDKDKAWTQQSADPLAKSEHDVQAEDVAYLIYTSGSTGKPKGVRVPHRAVANFLGSMQQEPGIGRDDRLAAVTTLSFDIAVLELMLPLSIGATVLIVPRETAMDGNLLGALLKSERATIMQATPGMWRMLLDSRFKAPSGFKALVGGESLPLDLAKTMLDRCGEVWNLYGPTETTIWSTIWKLDAKKLAAGISIGKPVANTQVWILDAEQQPCPIGVPGEICIGGLGVALGYHQRPDLSADRFVEDAAGLLYRTGDKGRWRDDGLLEHMGRLDFQVKVRGYRIELGEIEAACQQEASVAQCVVLAREDRPGDVRLVAYIVPTGVVRFDEEAMRSHMRGNLPDYMLPQHVVMLDKLPLLPNGKVDRKALPAPDVGSAREAAASQRVAPRNALEQRVLELMEAVLHLPGLSVHDNFFTLGGHSMLAAQLTTRINRDFDLQLPLRTLFESSTPEKLAAAIAKAQQGPVQAKRARIVAQASRTSAPLTPMQERICFIEELHPGRLLYNTPSAHRLTGHMDVVQFEKALQTMVQRQSALRTSFKRDNHGVRQQVIHEHIDFKLPFTDLSKLPEAEREKTLMTKLQAIIDSPMDLAQAPLLRMALFKLRDDQHAFLFMPHHLVWDGWSFDLLYEEMATLYVANDMSNALHPLTVSYGDYAQWLGDWMQTPEFGTQLSYWKKRITQAPAMRALSTDQPRKTGMSGTGATDWIHIDKALTEQLREIALKADATLNMLTLGVYVALMVSVAQHPSITVGMPVRGRLMTEVESVMGFFNNLLTLPFTPDPKLSFSDFMQQLKSDLLDDFSHQDIPFERVAQEADVASHTQAAGLYQGLFSFQDARGRSRQWGKLRHESILVSQKGATQDLGLWLMEVPKGMEGGITYNADIYSAQTAAALRERYMELLKKVIAQPSLSLAELMDTAGSTSAQQLVHLSVDAAERGIQAPAAAPSPSSANNNTAANDPAAVTRPVLVSQTTLNETERALIDIWAGLLDKEPSEIAAHDNFFDLGGSSLLAMRAIEQTQRVLGLTIEPNRYLHETLVQLARVSSSASVAINPGENTQQFNPAHADEKPGFFKRLFGWGRKTGS
jgi:amino acid adenylation domain-containing protein